MPTALPIMPNIALGRIAQLALEAKTPIRGNEKLYWMLLQATGLEAYSALQDYADVASLLAASNDEATFTGYTAGGLAVTGANISITTQNTPNNKILDITVDPLWNPTTVQNIGAIMLVFEPDSTASNNANRVPLFIDAFVQTTANGTPLTYPISTSGIWLSSQP